MKENDQNRVRLDDASVNQVVGGSGETGTDTNQQTSDTDSKPADEKPQVSVDANEGFDLMRLLQNLPK